MAQRLTYFLLHNKEDFARGSGAGIVVDGHGISLAKGCCEGVYDTRVFDCGERGMKWHRLTVEGSALKNCLVTVYAAETESGAGSEDAKVRSFQNPEDVLLFGVEGRYLRLRFVIRESAAVRISRVKIRFPMQTWLSYLPEIYREQAEQDSFFKRYLGIFQVIYEDMTERIAHSAQRFSSFTEDEEALLELSGWLGMENGELWKKEQRRYLIRHAVRLSEIRGTAAYLKELLFLAVGKNVYLVEYGSLLPYFDGGETEETLKRLYTAGPYEFTLLLEQSGQADEKELHLIGKIVETAKPAEMACRVVAPPPYLFLGQHTYLGINSVLGRYRTLRLDGTCAMPFSIIAGREPDNEKSEIFSL